MKSEDYSSHPKNLPGEQAQAATAEARHGCDDTEETYVPSKELEDSPLAPTGLDNPFWT
jgi:hypothetical protein